MATKNNPEELRNQNMQEAASKTEQFFEKNKKTIYTCFIAVLAVALVALLYSRFYLQPKKAEAADQLYHAEQAFAQGNYELALNGDDNNMGFDEVISKYGRKAGAAVYLYAGVSALQQGNFEEAIGFLKKYDGNDKILLGRAQACIGDAYVGLEDYKTALGWFEKAAATSDNLFSATYLLKAGVTAEKLGDTQKALAAYKQIKDQYRQAPEAIDIDKYIVRIESAK
jgi:tetratricopeptide (TPR) repeat protein